MSGLNLIQGYSSETDEENDEYPNVDITVNRISNSKTKLPVPETILSWKGVTHHEEVVDDPTKHDGRIRSIKHERGNWASLVYIDYVPNEEMFTWMKSISLQFADTINVFEEFHVSLTRTLILKYHWIGSFVEAVKSIVENSEIFVAELGKIKIFCNEEKTRTFMSITIQSATKSFERITGALDKALNDYNLPQFYEDASYHISFAWCLGDQRDKLETMLPIITSSFYNFLSENPEQQYLHIDTVRCKIAHKLYHFKMK